jgi:cation diffusion facilitator CzcD-associated flavoprotein CzcO
VSEELFDVAVVGGGQGGIYTTYRLDREGFSVVGIDGGADFGGVWYHNRYPGARVDTDSVDYCFQFSRELYEKWRWPERYADAATLFDYHSFVADELNVRRFFRFKTWLRDSQWSASDNRWHLTTDQGDRMACRFLVMCTGVLSTPKSMSFNGLDRFKGEWVQTNRWPDREVSFKDRRIAIIGTGSTGAQAVPCLAEDAKQLFVFQRHPHYAIPAQNRPTDPGLQDSIARNLELEREEFLRRGGPSDPRGGTPRLRADPAPARPAAEYTSAQRQDLLERQWDWGGHGMSYLFADETTNPASNDIVAEFVRQKIGERVADPAVVEKLRPYYPIGTRRLILEIGYYEAFNQDNVTLVDALQDPIVEITETGVRTVGGHYQVDLLIFAIGFQSFLGPLEAAGLRNDCGLTPKDVWAHGPRTLFGLMTPGFPNMFHPTSAGSPSVLGNAMLQHEYFGDWIADCMAYMGKRGHSTIEASDSAANEWTSLVDDYAQRILPIRRGENQYMVHVNDDGTRLFIPFCAGMGEYLPKVYESISRDYEGFLFH